jgi:hypothetical protein
MSELSGVTQLIQNDVDAFLAQAAEKKAGKKAEKEVEKKASKKPKVELKKAKSSDKKNVAKAKAEPKKELKPKEKLVNLVTNKLLACNMKVPADIKTLTMASLKELSELLDKKISELVSDSEEAEETEEETEIKEEAETKEREDNLEENIKPWRQAEPKQELTLSRLFEKLDLIVEKLDKLRKADLEIQKQE